ncbi:MAG: class I SAM-dependent methyltransferase [Dehalococcoidia bacterium]
MYPRLGPRLRRALLQRAGRDRASDPAVVLPDWYLCHWHFAPGGYLSAPGRAWYAWIISRFYYQFGERQAQRLVARELRRAGAKHLLEVGCGPGRLARRLTRQGFAVAAVDLAPGWVTAARRAAPRADIRHADGEALPWPSETFDAVVLAHVAGHVPLAVASALLAEAERVLAPGAPIVLVEHPWHALDFGRFTVALDARFRWRFQRLVVLRAAATAADALAVNPDGLVAEQGHA